MILSYLHQFHLEEDEGRPRRVKGVGGPSTLSVSKFLQEVVLLPPDTSVSVSKFLQEVVLLPPDEAVSVSKAVLYVVLEIAPPSSLPTSPRARQALFQAYELEEEVVLRPRRFSVIPSAPSTVIPSFRRSIPNWVIQGENSGPDYYRRKKKLSPILDDSITFLCMT